MTVHLVPLAGIRVEGVQAYACSVALSLVESLIRMRRVFRWRRGASWCARGGFNLVRHLSIRIACPFLDGRAARPRDAGQSAGPV
jgi:hypothetical protein